MSRGTRRIAAALALAAVAALGAACAGTSSTATGSTSGSAAPPVGTGTAPVAVDAGAGGPGPTSDAVKASRLLSTDADGTQHYAFAYGPIRVKPGQNNITFSKGQVPKPPADGWITGIRPDIKYRDGTTPPVDVIHLHHGVWLNGAAQDATISFFPERFFAAGEEKTYLTLPKGYGYPYKPSDAWTINYMLHNLFEKPDDVWITYEMDFVPKDAAAASGMRNARPIWLDVQNGEIYPVFDVHKGSGTNGRFTYPTDDPNAYGGGMRSNQWIVDRDGVLLGGATHLHPGGLYGDLYLERFGASATPGSEAASSVTGNKAHLFRSEANYYEPAGAVSWDVAMTATLPDWRVKVRKGDVLSTDVTYDSGRASWYESMGITVLWMADEGDGADPFATKVDQPGKVTHGHLAENDNHGGAQPGLPDPLQLPVGQTVDRVDIEDFAYAPGDMELGQSVPVFKKGAKVTFVNADAPKENGIWHTITACKAPCNLSTGIAYPLADGDVEFDSGQLGKAGPPTAGRVDWVVPDLPPGTYTYFCRVHPFMRGAFKVDGSG